MDWSYDARRGKVMTTWTVKTEPLVPGKPDIVMQGWLAHHWRDATTETSLDGPEYLTPRGTLRCSAGNRFQWATISTASCRCFPRRARGWDARRL